MSVSRCAFQRPEGGVDEEGRPDHRLEDGEGPVPRRGGVLPVPDHGPDEAEPVDGVAAARARAGGSALLLLLHVASLSGSPAPMGADRTEGGGREPEDGRCRGAGRADQPAGRVTDDGDALPEPIRWVTGTPVVPWPAGSPVPRLRA